MTMPKANPDEIRIEDRRTPAWNWSAGVDADGESELDELRRTVTAMREEITELREQLSRCRVGQRELRDALAQLVRGGVLRRRRIVAGLRERGLLRA